MPHHEVAKTFTIQVTVSARANIVTGGSSAHDSDEPPWAEVERVDVYSIDIGGHEFTDLGAFRNAIEEAAKEEFSYDW